MIYQKRNKNEKTHQPKHSMTCNPAKHHRRSIRLKEYDYSSQGYYFITLCIHDRWIRMFGDVDNGKMVLTECGIIANEWIEKLSGRFTDAMVDSYVIMPNHIHLILRIVVELSAVAPVVGAIHELPLRRGDIDIQHHELPRQRETDNETYRKNRRVMTIPKIIGYYRMNTAKQINVIRQTSGIPVWQRNYWEHIIRDKNELFRIRQYIKNNPANWERDTLNDGTGTRVGAIHELPLQPGDTDIRKHELPLSSHKTHF
jgi:REP element-mobilizing transposase RayT